MVHPDWLHKKVREKEDKFRQQKLVDIFSRQQRNDAERVSDDHNGHKQNKIMSDMEDFRNAENSQVRRKPIVHSYSITNRELQDKADNLEKGVEQNDRDETGDKHLRPLLQKDIHEEIDRSVDYHGWLELKKRKWKETLEKRKRQRYYYIFQLSKHGNVKVEYVYHLGKSCVFAIFS